MDLKRTLRDIFIDRLGNEHKSNAAVRMADLDSLGVVHSNIYFIFFEDGFLSFMKWLGTPCSDFDKQGITFPVVSSSCDYRSPSFFEDVLEIHTSISNLGNSSFTCNHKVYRTKKDNCILSAEGKMVRVVMKDLKTVNLSQIDIENIC